MTANEVMNLGLGLLVKVLELVSCSKLGDIHSIRQDAIRSTFQEVFAFVGCNVGDCGKDVGGMSGSSFHAVAMVDSATPSFIVHVEVCQVIVKIDGAGTEISA